MRGGAGQSRRPAARILGCHLPNINCAFYCSEAASLWPRQHRRHRQYVRGLPYLWVNYNVTSNVRPQCVPYTLLVLEAQKGTQHAASDDSRIAVSMRKNRFTTITSDVCCTPMRYDWKGVFQTLSMAWYSTTSLVQVRIVRSRLILVMRLQTTVSISPLTGSFLLKVILSEK